MRVLVNWPMRLLLSIKLRGIRKLLTVAEEQTQDALRLVCISCSPAGISCERPYQCRVQRFKDREALLNTALFGTEERIARLGGL